MTQDDLIKYVLPPLGLFYLLAVLVQLPKTRPLRLCLWPVIWIMSFRAATRFDVGEAVAPGDPRNVHHNFCFCTYQAFLCLRCTDFAISHYPFRRMRWSFDPVQNVDPKSKTPPSISFTGAMLDAFDLISNPRGVGWNWGSKAYAPSQETPDSTPKPTRLQAAIAFFMSYLKALALFDFALFAQQSWTLYPSTSITLSPNGGTIFDPTLPPLLRYLRVAAITVLCAIGLFTSFQMTYCQMATFGVTFLGQDPEQWPPMFDKPWAPDSLSDYWGKRWHQTFRRIFVINGAKPLASLFGRAGAVIGSFLVSGVMHDLGMWGIGAGTEFRSCTLVFVMMGVGCVLEGVWEKVTGRKVQGVLGWVWAMGWMITWGSLVVDAWARRGLIEAPMLQDGMRPTLWWIRVTKKWLEQEQHKWFVV